MRPPDFLGAASLTQELRDVLLVVGLLLLVWGARRGVPGLRLVGGAPGFRAVHRQRRGAPRQLADCGTARGEPVTRPTPPTGGSSVVVPNVISEAAAAQKWCPWARVSSPADEPAFNRLAVGISQGQEVPASHVPDMARCIGSRCMAWRQRARAGHGYCGAVGPL